MTNRKEKKPESGLTLSPIIAERRKNGSIEVLVQMGFSELGSKYELVVSDVTDNKNPIVIGKMTQTKNVSLWAVHEVEIKKGGKIELKLTEFPQNGGTLVATEKVYT